MRRTLLLSATNGPQLGDFGFDIAGMGRTALPGDDIDTYPSNTLVARRFASRCGAMSKPDR